MASKKKLTKCKVVSLVLQNCQNELLLCRSNPVTGDTINRKIRDHSIYYCVTSVISDEPNLTQLHQLLSPDVGPNKFSPTRVVWIPRVSKLPIAQPARFFFWVTSLSRELTNCTPETLKLKYLDNCLERWAFVVTIAQLMQPLFRVLLISLYVQLGESPELYSKHRVEPAQGTIVSTM